MKIKNRHFKNPYKKRNSNSSSTGTSIKRAKKAEEVKGFRIDSLKDKAQDAKSSRRAGYFESLYKPQGENENK